MFHFTSRRSSQVVPALVAVLLPIFGCRSSTSAPEKVDVGASPASALKRSVPTKVIVYPAPPVDKSFFVKSARYSVTVENKPVFVYDFDPTDKLAKVPKSMDPQPEHWEQGVFGSFDFAGKVTVKVTCAETVTSAQVRPLSLGIMAKVSGKVVTFELSKAANFGLEINGDGTRPLFLFANPITPKPDKSDPNVIFIAGGKVYENYELPDDIKGKTIYIEGGAIVRAKVSLAGKKDVSNTKILGTGIVVGREPTQNQSLFGWTGESKNFEMNGPIFVSTHHGGEWAVVPFNVTGAKISNIKVFGMFRDAFDLFSCSNIVVDRCFFWAQDDACVIKASQYADILVSNITVQNTTTWNHGLMIGFETRAPWMEDITFKNCDVVRDWGNTGNPFKRENFISVRNPIVGIVVSDQARVSNIRYEDIRVEFPWTDDFFQFMTEKNYASTHAEHGSIHGVYVKNLRVLDADPRLTGIYDSEARAMSPQGGISNILIEGLYWKGKEIPDAASAKMWGNENAKNIVVQPLAPRTSAPLAPSEPKVEALGGFVNKISWRDNSGNEDGFLVERKDGAGAWKIARDVVPNYNDLLDRNLTEGTVYTYRIRAYNAAGKSKSSAEAKATALGQVPFGGVARAVPGVVQSEDFDEGGEGVSFHDTTAGNSAGSTNAGRYRSGVGPDIGIAWDDAAQKGEENVGWTADGEWLEYTLNVATAGKYIATVESNSGGDGGSIHFEWNGKVVSAPARLGGTGGWGAANWKGFAVPIELTAGRGVLRLVMDKAGFNLNKITFTKQG